MEIRSDLSTRHSVDEFLSQFTMCVDSAVGIVHVRAGEMKRAAAVLRSSIVSSGSLLKEWDVVNGFRTMTPDSINNLSLHGDDNIDIANAFEAPLRTIRSNEYHGESKYYIYHAPHVFMENNPQMSEMLRIYADILPSTSIVIVILTPDISLPSTDQVSLLSIRFAPPSIVELMDSLEFVLDGVNEDQPDWINLSQSDKERICYTGIGMTKSAFETHTALSAVKAGNDGKERLTVDDLVQGIAVGKTEVVNSNDLLELYPSTSMSEVGGLDNLKKWVDMRRGCYSDDAAAFGVEPPKGIVLVGIPGTGKSLVAKAISGVLGVPLVRLDFGRVFNMMLGESERRMRTALHMVEDMSPIVLFCDEIDKGLGGIGSGGDSGVSSRIFGTFLTWLQECKKPVFTMVTANNVTGLPPELLRRGRFDGIFYTTMPNDSERREVIDIHLKKRNRSLDDYRESDVKRLVSIAAEYVPAEIESAIKDALVYAFSNGEELSIKHIIDALRAMVPLSKSFADKIKAMDDWAKHNATPANGISSATADTPLVTTRRRVRSAKLH